MLTADMIVSMHKPGLEKLSGGVCIFCWDGEMIYTKSGDLFGRRGFHNIGQARMSQATMDELKSKMPMPSDLLGDNPHIYVESADLDVLADAFGR